MKLFPSLIIAVLILFSFTNTGFAQNNDDIFVPVQNPSAQTSEKQASPLNALIQLQNNLYRIVLTFDERASHYSGTSSSESSFCSELDNSLKNYVKKNSAEVQSLVTQLVAETKDIAPQQQAEISKSIHIAMTSSGVNRKRAQEILYICLYRFKNEDGTPKNYSVEKTLREWFTLQAPLVDLWLGPVD